MASGDDAEYAQMQARLRRLTEPIAGPPPRHWQASRIRGELQAPATAREHAASDQIGAAKKLPRLRSPGRRAPRTAIASDPDWQALDQLDEVGWTGVYQRIVGELQAMQTATEPAARDVPSSSGRQGQATVDKRVESIEKLTKEQMAMQTATEPAARDVPSSSDRQATVDNRMESIKKLTKEQIAVKVHPLQHRAEQTATFLQMSMEKLTNEQIWLHEHTCKAVDVLWGSASALHEVKEKLTKEQLDGTQQLTKEQIAGELQSAMQALTYGTQAAQMVRAARDLHIDFTRR